jgi:hypothetical protein
MALGWTIWVTGRLQGSWSNGPPDYSMALGSVGDPDPDDTHVFGPPGSRSGSIIQRYGSGSFPFLKKVFSGLK